MVYIRPKAQTEMFVKFTSIVKKSLLLTSLPSCTGSPASTRRFLHRTDQSKEKNDLSFQELKGDHRLRLSKSSQQLLSSKSIRRRQTVHDLKAVNKTFTPQERSNITRTFLGKQIENLPHLKLSQQREPIEQKASLPNLSKAIVLDQEIPRTPRAPRPSHQALNRGQYRSSDGQSVQDPAAPSQVQYDNISPPHIDFGISYFTDFGTPLVRAYPSQNASNYQSLQEDTPRTLDFVDVATSWKGLSFLDTQQLSLIQSVFLEALQKLVSQEVSMVCQQARRQYLLGGTVDIGGWDTSIEDHCVSFPRSQLLSEMIESLLGRDASPDSRKSMASLIRLHLKSTDSLMHSERADGRDTLLAIRVKFDSLSFVNGPTIESAWVPDTILFNSLRPELFEEEDLLIVPRYVSHGVFSQANLAENVVYAVENCPHWLSWDDVVKGFRGRVPAYSDLQREGWLYKFHHEGQSQLVRILQLIVRASLTDRGLGASGRHIEYERMIRARLTIRVLPKPKQVWPRRFNYRNIPGFNSDSTAEAFSSSTLQGELESLKSPNNDSPTEDPPAELIPDHNASWTAERALKYDLRADKLQYGRYGSEKPVQHFSMLAPRKNNLNSGPDSSAGGHVGVVGNVGKGSERMLDKACPLNSSNHQFTPLHPESTQSSHKREADPSIWAQRATEIASGASLPEVREISPPNTILRQGQELPTPTSRPREQPDDCDEQVASLSFLNSGFAQQKTEEVKLQNSLLANRDEKRDRSLWTKEINNHGPTSNSTRRTAIDNQLGKEATAADANDSTYRKTPESSRRLMKAEAMSKSADSSETAASKPSRLTGDSGYQPIALHNRFAALEPFIETLSSSSQMDEQLCVSSQGFPTLAETGVDSARKTRQYERFGPIKPKGRFASQNNPQESKSNAAQIDFLISPSNTSSELSEEEPRRLSRALRSTVGFADPIRTLLGPAPVPCRRQDLEESIKEQRAVAHSREEQTKRKMGSLYSDNFDDIFVRSSSTTPISFRAADADSQDPDAHSVGVDCTGNESDAVLSEVEIDAANVTEVILRDQPSGGREGGRG